MLLLCIWAIRQGQDARQLLNDVHDVGRSIEALQIQQEALRNEIDNIEWIVPEPSEQRFIPLDIDLSEDLQQFTWDLYATLPLEQDEAFRIVMAIMWRESRYQLDAVNYNANGTTDIGVCQINSCNWDWLAADGIDVHTTEGNIAACITILGESLEDYTLEESLAAYGVGISGMRAGRGFEAAQELIEYSNNL